MYRYLVCTLLLLWGVACVRAENWPNWRGPNQIGIGSERDLPVTWSATKNVRWKVALPEEGKTFVLAAGREFRKIATNDVDESTYAGLAASKGELFLRTWKHLYCIGREQ